MTRLEAQMISSTGVTIAGVTTNSVEKGSSGMGKAGREGRGGVGLRFEEE